MRDVHQVANHACMGRGVVDAAKSGVAHPPGVLLDGCIKTRNVNQKPAICQYEAKIDRRGSRGIAGVGDSPEGLPIPGMEPGYDSSLVDVVVIRDIGFVSLDRCEFHAVTTVSEGDILLAKRSREHVTWQPSRS